MTRVILGGNDYDSDDPEAPILLGGNLGTSGAGTVTRTSPPADADVKAGTCVLWWDAEAGTLRFKGRRLGMEDLRTGTVPNVEDSQ